MRKYLPLVLLIAALVRLQDAGRVLSDAVFRGYDAYYHMRLVEVIVKSGYRPEVDCYLNYPYCLKITWLPLYDYILAAPGLFFGFKASEIFAVIFPVILGVASTLLIYVAAKNLFESEAVAILAAVIFALCPASVQESVVGFADHSAWVVFLTLCTICALLSRYKLLAAIPLTLLALSWLGAPLYAGALAIALLLHARDRDLLMAAISFAVASIAAVYNFFLGLSFVAVAAFLAAGYAVKKFGERAVLAYIATCLFAVAAAYLLPVGFVKAGIDYLLGRNVYLATIAEAQPFRFFDIWWFLGLFTSPFAIAALGRRRFLDAFAAVSLFLAALQVRFVEVLAIPVAILSAYGLTLAADRAGFKVLAEEEEEARIIRRVKKKKVEEVSRSDYAVLAVFLLVVFVPSIAAALRPVELSKDWEQALKWMRNGTEETSYYLHPESRPEYSVLSWWDYGNWIVYIAKRPVVCNNFQAGAADAAKFFVAQSEDEALKIAEKRGVRYVVTCDEMDLSGKFTAIMKIAGYNTEFMSGDEIRSVYNSSMLYKLHVENAEKLKHFELVKDFGSVKVFKIVPLG